MANISEWFILVTEEMERVGNEGERHKNMKTALKNLGSYQPLIQILIFFNFGTSEEALHKSKAPAQACLSGCPMVGTPAPFYQEETTRPSVSQWCIRVSGSALNTPDSLKRRLPKGVPFCQDLKLK